MKRSILLILILLGVVGGAQAQGSGTAASIYRSTFANLGTPANGSVRYVTDGTPNTSPCTGSGTGAFAQRTNGVWVCGGSAAVAPADATYITETANSSLTNEFALGSLATGILKNATTTGIPSIAAAGTDYLDPTHLTGSPYDVAVSFDGAPAASATIRIVAPRAFNSGASFVGTLCSAGTAATAQTDFLVKNNGSTVATLRFAASGTTCSIVSPTTTSFVATDVITIVAPGSADATLANIAISIKGSLP